MTPERLEELKELAKEMEKAGPGWDKVGDIINMPYGDLVYFMRAEAALPELIAEVERLQAALASGRGPSDGCPPYKLEDA